MSSTPATGRITAGQLSVRVKLQSPPPAIDDLGQATGAWVDVAEVWARPRPLRSRELFAAGQVQNISDVEFTIRWRADVRATWRVLWDDVPHDITGPPIDVDGQRQWLQLLASAGVRDGR